MPLQIFEDMPGARVTATSLSIDYNITGAQVSGNPSQDYQAVRAALLAYAPRTNSPPGALYDWPRRGLDLKEAGWGVWKATIQWASLIYQYALKIGGSQQQVRCDLTLTNIFSDSGLPSGTAPSAYSAGYKGAAIGWDGRSVHGCSIFIPERTWTESVEIPISDYSFDYEDQVAALMATPVNSKLFRGYYPGEVRFVGMQAQLSTQNPDYVTGAFEFSQSCNADLAGNNTTGTDTRITIDNISNIVKAGWDYLDVHYTAPQYSSGAPSMYPPKAAYVLVHRVYNQGDFTPLNIGTSEALPLWQGPIAT